MEISQEFVTQLGIGGGTAGTVIAALWRHAAKVWRTLQALLTVGQRAIVYQDANAKLLALMMRADLDPDEKDRRARIIVHEMNEVLFPKPTLETP